jgi:hypothetical protein
VMCECKPLSTVMYNFTASILASKLYL